MPRTSKPTWAPLPEFAGTGGPIRDRALQDRLKAYVVKAYRQGMTIREITNWSTAHPPPSSASSPPTRCPAAFRVDHPPQP